jgi:hypothetical protein
MFIPAEEALDVSDAAQVQTSGIGWPALQAFMGYDAFTGPQARTRTPAISGDNAGMRSMMAHLRKHGQSHETPVDESSPTLSADSSQIQKSERIKVALFARRSPRPC